MYQYQQPRQIDPRIVRAAQQMAAQQVNEIKQAAIEQIAGYKQRLMQVEEQLRQTHGQQEQFAAYKRRLAQVEQELKQANAQKEEVLAKKQVLIVGLESQINGLEDAVMRMTDESADLQNKNLRLQAEMQNSRRRIEQTYAQRTEQVKATLLNDFISVADNLERALNYGEDGDGQIRAGVEATLRQWQQLLQQYEVRPIEAQGQPFDPTLHEAISTVTQSNVEPDTVVNVIQTGYLLGDKLLRPAQVVVAMEGKAEL